jgi:hypothetical protein
MSDNTSKLDQYRQVTNQIEQQLETEHKQWDSVLSKTAKLLKADAKNLYLVDADITNYRQMTTSEIRTYALMIYKENKALKPLIKSRFEWYSGKYQIALKNSGDKMRLIESDVAEIQYRIDLLDNHVDFLKGTGDNLKQMGYTVKNRLELLNILGLD